MLQLRPTNSRLILFLSLWAGFFARAQDAVPEPAVGTVLLDPSSITLTGHLESSGPTTVELAIRHIQKQIDQQHADDAARSPLEPFWKASFWDSPLWMFVPRPMGPPKTNVDDPFFTPAYMTVISRQQDYEMKSFEKSAQKIFER
jgi:hypothetical protein